MSMYKCPKKDSEKVVQKGSYCVLKIFSACAWWFWIDFVILVLHSWNPPWRHVLNQIECGAVPYN